MFAFFSLKSRLAAQVVAGLLAVAGLSQCGIHEQMQQAKASKNVDVRLASVDQATVGGVNVLNLRQSADLGTAERAPPLPATCLCACA